MGKFKTYKFDKNTGGLNTRASEISIHHTESPDLLNVKLTKEGAIVKEKGFTLLHELPIAEDAEIGGLHHYIKSSNNTNYTIVAAGDKLYNLNGETFVDISRVAPYEPNRIWNFITFNDSCIGVNGYDVPQKYSGGSAAVSITNAPVASSVVESYNNRVFMAGDPDEPTKLSYSALLDPDDWTTVNDAGWLEVGLNDGQKITALKAYFDILLVFKERSIYALSGYSGDPTSENFFFVKQLNASVGAVSHRAIEQVGNTLFFLSDDGVYALEAVQVYGDLGLKNVSYKISSLFEGLNKSEMENSFSVHDFEENRLWFFVPSGSSTENNLILIYDYSLNAWTKRSGFTSKCGLVYKRLENPKYEFITGSYDGYLQKQKDGFTYAGEPINAYYVTPWYDFGHYRKRKRVRDIQFVIEPTGVYELDVTYKWDYGVKNTRNLSVELDGMTAFWGTSETGSHWDEAYWNSEYAFKVTKPVDGGGHVLQMTMKNTNRNESFVILGWYINVIERGLR